LSITLIETQRKVAVNSHYQLGHDPRELEDWLEAQLERFAMLGINADSYTVHVGYVSFLWTFDQFVVQPQATVCYSGLF
jgi:hypothetical protein